MTLSLPYLIIEVSHAREEDATREMHIIIFLFAMALALVISGSGDLCNKCRCVILDGGHLLDCENQVLSAPLQGWEVAGFTHINLKKASFVASCSTFQFPGLYLVDMREAEWGTMCQVLKTCTALQGKVRQSRRT